MAEVYYSWKPYPQPPPTQRPRPDQWEYAILPLSESFVDDLQQMTELGKVGYELVNVTPPVPGWTVGGQRHSEQRAVAYFKRRIIPIAGQ